MIKSIHFILTYMCNLKCDHCFLYCHPYARGTFSMARVEKALDEFERLGSIRSVGFEGGEPFLFYPVLCAGVRAADEKGFSTSIQTNCFWAISKEDALLWLRPLKAAGLGHLDVSDDAFHHGDNPENNAVHARSAAEELGIDVDAICIRPPEPGGPAGEGQVPGEPVYLGGAKLSGRAVETLTKGLPKRPCKVFTHCPYEDFRDPGRVHLDPFGNVHLCQGISMGNAWEESFSSLIKAYAPEAHPIAGPILQGGPLGLADAYGVNHDDVYVDACHMCTGIRRQLMDRFPEYLTPRQVYGVE